jgi:hypothetical protein
MRAYGVKMYMSNKKLDIAHKFAAHKKALDKPRLFVHFGKRINV